MAGKTSLLRPARVGVLLLTTLALACQDRDPTSLLGPDGPAMQVASAPVVNSVADPGDGTCDDTECTLREAIAFASAGAEITFDPALTDTGSKILDLDVASGALAIAKNLTITGPGSNKVIIRAPGSPTYAQVFSIGAGTVWISGLGITHGYHVYGGGVFVGTGATLTLDHCSVTGNTATTSGGGIENRGTLTVTNSEIAVNQGGSLGAGGINNQAGAVLTVANSTIAGNQALLGAGIENRGTLIVTNSTISDNTATTTGAGLSIDAGTLTMVNSTVTGNQAASYGGGIKIASSDARIILSTITGNRGGNSAAVGGGGIYSTQSGSTQTYVKGSIIWGNTLSDGSTANDVAASSSSGFSSLGYNLVGAAGANVNFTANFISTGDQTGVASASLGELTVDGGSTATYALLPGSPALDQIPAASCTDHTGAAVSTDQRGITRPQGTACDVGAYEKVVIMAQDPGAPVVNTRADHSDGSCDTGDCTLREAISYASSGATITFAVTGDIDLASTLIINKSLIIRGPGAESLSLRGQNSYRVFEIYNFSEAIAVELHGMTVRDGRATNVSGGGMNISYATALLDSVVVRDNTVTGTGSLFGAGINVFQATVTVRNSTITGNSFSGDAGMQDGGGIAFGVGALTVENSAISGNSAHGGGGIRVLNGVATVRNSTVSGNSGSWLGGGVYISDGTLNVEFSTVAGNSGYTGGGVYAEGGATVLSAALLADNTCVTSGLNAKPDLGDPSGRVTATYTLIESASGHSFTDGANGNIVGVDPGLGPLADNGGFTWTHALATESAAIDQIPSGTIGCGSTVDTDQRGVSRPQGDACDIGAYETVGLPTPDFTFNLSTLPAKTYGDAAFSVADYASSTNSGGAITFALGEGSAGCSVTSAGEVTINGAAVDPASCVIAASLAADATYAAAGPLSQSFNIAKASTTVSINNVPSSATVGETFTPTYTSPSDGTKSTTSSTTGVCTVSGGVVSYIAAGTCTLVAHVAAGTNWLAADGAPQGFTVSPPTPITPNFTFVLPALSNTYGDGPFSVASYANSTNSNGAITFAVGNSSAGCSVTSAGQVTITGAAVGDAYCMIEASLAAAGVYTAAGPLSQSFQIAKAAPVQVVIQVLPLGAQVGGGFPATVETDGDGATSVTSSTLTVCTASGVDVSYIAAGTCTLVAHVAEGPNFTSADGGPQSFVVSPAAPIAPNFTFNLSTLPAKTYGDAAFSVAGFASSTNSTGAITFALGASSAGCSVTSAGEVTITGAAVDPASCVITASLAADGTYAAAGPLTQSFNITKASTTVSINNVPSSATVGETFTPTYTSPSDGTKSTTSSTTGVCTVSGGVVSYIAAGTCTLVAHVAAGTNWLAADGAPQGFTVSPPTPITPNFTFVLPALSNTYGDGPFSVASYANSTNSNGAITFAVGNSSAGCSVTSAGQVTITGAAVGDAYCMIEASLAAAGVYTAAGPLSQSFQIAKAALTVTANDATITYLDATPTFSVGYSGFVIPEAQVR